MEQILKDAENLQRRRALKKDVKDEEDTQHRIRRITLAKSVMEQDIQDCTMKMNLALKQHDVRFVFIEAVMAKFI